MMQMGNGEARRLAAGFAAKAVAIVGVIVVLGGCAGGGVSAAKLQQANADYSAGKYQAAYNGAVAAYHGSNSTTKDEAAYVAGLSAYRLRKLSDAEKYLEPLADHRTDSTMAGMASATLGMVERERSDTAKAAGHFSRAAKLLEGQDRAEAAYNAGLAYQEMKNWSAARAKFVIARGASKDQAFSAKVEAALDATGFTIQLGAYESAENARKTAERFERSSAARTIGPARVVTTRDKRGQPMHLVQVGIFQSYESAKRAMATIREPAMITSLAAAGS